MGEGHHVSLEFLNQCKHRRQLLSDKLPGELREGRGVECLHGYGGGGSNGGVGGVGDGVGGGSG